MSKDQPNTFDMDLDLYTLGEASVKSRTSIASIIKAAADGHISLYTTIPIGWEVFSVDISDLPPCEYKTNNHSLTIKTNNKLRFESRLKVDPSIELLKLSKNDCARINLNQHVHQSAFSSGLKTGYDHPPITITPEQEITSNPHNKTTDIFKILNRCFIVSKKQTYLEMTARRKYNQEHHHELFINPNMLRVAHEDLEKINNFVNNTTKEKTAESSPKIQTPRKNPPLKHISHRLYTPGRARTKLLDALYRTARNSWEVHLIRGKHENSDNIKWMIKRLCPECSNSLVETSFSIINQDANEKTKKGQFFLTNCYWTLIDAYEKFYCAPKPKEPEKHEIIKWLEHEKNLFSTAIEASQIIDPKFIANTPST